MTTLSGRVLKAMSVFGGVQMLSILCSVVRMKFVALWLGPIGWGLFSVYNLAAETLGSLTQLGLRDSAVRTVATGGEDTGARVAMVRRWAVVLGGLGFAVMLCASPLLSRMSFGDWSHTADFAMLGAVLPLTALSAAEIAVMQGGRRLKVLARASLKGAVGGLALSLPMFYFWRLDSVIPSIVAYALAGWIAVRSERRGEAWEPAAPPAWGRLWEQGKEMIRLGAYMTAAAFCTNLAGYAFVSYLTSTYGEGAAGLYQAGFTVANRYIGMIFAAVVMEYYPRLSAAGGSGARTRVFVAHETRLLLLVLAPAAAVLIGAARWVVMILYTDEFEGIVPFITLAMPGVMFRAVSWSMAFVILARGDGRTFLATEAASAALGLGLNIAAWRLWGVGGLGVSYTLWYGAYAAMIAIVCARRYGLRLAGGVWAHTWGAAAVTAAIGGLGLWAGQGWALGGAVPVAAVCAAGLAPMLRRRRKGVKAS